MSANLLFRQFRKIPSQVAGHAVHGIMFSSGNRSEFLSADTLAQELRLFARQLKRRLHDNSDAGDLKPSQVAVLHHLENHGAATVSALARAGGMRSQSMGTVVAALERAGLISGSSDPSDGRQTLLVLTDDCRAWLTKGRASRQDWLSNAIQTRLTPEELATLAEAMPLILRIVASGEDFIVQPGANNPQASE
ncbi:MarR family transcriptional regulator (plasmid) [Novosphingobium sp. BL-8A]|uniref:MarR family winged helix-turn-helix transcriptional regulator n=1 Tax=Novosphingobium sp. BL-8A TaxID=3127639 RepID=UPI0037575193